MKKVIKQDGEKKVFILEDGSEIPFDKVKPVKKEEKKEEPKKDDKED
jgi:hypothetical protein